MDLPDDDSIEINLETIKQILFGGSIGMICGIAANKAQLPVLLSTSFFVLYRGAVYDGHIRTSWSPLAMDDSSLTKHMHRKLRRETVSDEKRLEKFLKKNAFVLLAFSGGILAGRLSS